ncbi:GtrA family protein [Streptomyces sp. NPDC005648]|uniref:GtrA family protein n=1 Tax=Streptomyces sp. NPDC005648 TaxID=3157044 RepID=UPI0033BB6C8F
MDTLRTEVTPEVRVPVGPLASFLRFVVCGGGVGLLSSAAVPLVALTMPWVVANAVITVASTLLCTELHARVTFGTGRRPGLREHWRSAGSATAAYVVTCAAMFVLHTVQPSPSMATEQIVYLGASALAGVGRFVVLRLFVFAGGTEKGTRKPRRMGTRARGAWFAPTVTVVRGWGHTPAYGVRVAAPPVR